MRRLAILAVAALAPLTGARAAPSAAALAEVGVHAQAGAAAPLGLAFMDEAGRPTTLGGALQGRPGVLVFADYHCRTLCGPALTMTAAGLTATGLKPGRDFRLAVVGLDPALSPSAAAAFGRARLASDPPLAAASTLLTGSAASVATLTGALGYGYLYDPDQKQFVHPAAAYVLTPSGEAARVLSEVGMNGPDLRLALVEAGQGRVGSLVDRLNLLCHGFDIAAGTYTGGIVTGLRAAGVLTLALMAAGLAALVARRRRLAA